jgi:hypothetical protein
VQNSLQTPVHPPPGTRNCDPEIVAATDVLFLLKNKKKPRNFIWGELVTGGELSFLIENLPKDGTGCPGKWMFEQMMQHFGVRVAAIQGNWTYGDNLATVNQLTAGGVLTLEEAAKQGPTGRYATAWGFTKVEVLPQTLGSPGHYSQVYVLFKK